MDHNIKTIGLDRVIGTFLTRWFPVQTLSRPFSPFLILLWIPRNHAWALMVCVASGYPEFYSIPGAMPRALICDTFGQAIPLGRCLFYLMHLRFPGYSLPVSRFFCHQNTNFIRAFWFISTFQRSSSLLSISCFRDFVTNSTNIRPGNRPWRGLITQPGAAPRDYLSQHKNHRFRSSHRHIPYPMVPGTDLINVPLNLFFGLKLNWASGRLAACFLQQIRVPSTSHFKKIGTANFLEICPIALLSFTGVKLKSKSFIQVSSSPYLNACSRK